MSIELREYLTAISSERTPVWVDAWEYGCRLLLKGKQPPWQDVGAFVSFHKQIQGLVNSDVVVVELESFYSNYLQVNSHLLAQMGEKKRLGYALRTLLADTAARENLVEITKALVEVYQGAALMLALPSPKRWMGLAFGQAHSTDPADIGWDDAESASMYLADYLRSFASCAISGLLVRDENGPANDSELARYQPVLNVAEHYRWSLVLDGCSDNYQPQIAQGVAYCLSSDGKDAACVKMSLDNWEAMKSAKTDTTGFWYVTVPDDSNPESVLDTLSLMRAT